MMFASIDLTPIVTFVASLLQGTGPWGMLAGAVLLFLTQKLGGQSINLSGFVSKLLMPSTAQDKLIADLKARLEAKVRAATSPASQTVDVPAAKNVADEYMKWVNAIEQLALSPPKVQP